ncbi:MAG: endonuclease/exonuclease/phosphatase family protein [Elusimicrobia bacterium]|nr:endonuclease/exonuclease/phosphatase family protein [Elusimicrobiota bacterium]
MNIMLLLLALLQPSARGGDFLDKNSPELDGLRAAVFHAPARPPSQGPWVLRVLTYNVHGISPTLTAQDEQIQAQSLGRYREIARRLREARASGSGPQIVAIQEAWHGLSARTATESGYPYVVKGGGAKFPKLGGSGIYILSEFPVVASETIAYKECTGWDCVATKGALHVRVVVPELSQTLDVYTTHMNADEPPAKPADSRKARMAQIKDFAAFVRRTRDPAVPAVMAADFNFTYPGEDSALFERLVGASNSEKSCAASGDCAGDDPRAVLKDSVDHQFYIPGRQGSLKPTRVAQTFREPHNGKPLSDHWGLEESYILLRHRAP